MIRENKGNSKIDLLNNYVVIDIETTGLDPQFDEIIELGALKIENGTIVDSFSKLIKPKTPINDFITQLTGITNEMVETAPSIEEELPKYLKFINEQSIVGHNVNFDINFIYDNSAKILNKSFSNNYIDTLRLSRKLYPDLKNHKLITVCDYLKIDDSTHHRALSDCELTFKVYETIKKYIDTENIDLEALFKPKHYKLKAKEIAATTNDFDETNLVYGKYCVFTGALSITRKEAMQKVVNLGGKCEDQVTKQTNFLILGNIDYQKCKGEKSSKYRKAEEYILAGQDIQIISENVFFDMIGETVNSEDITSNLITETRKDTEYSEETLEKIMYRLNLNFVEHKDYEVNEKLTWEYINQARQLEKEKNIVEAVKLYEKAAYYGADVSDRLFILYKKCLQKEKIPAMLIFTMFVYYKLINPNRSDRIWKFMRVYEKYDNYIKQNN